MVDPLIAVVSRRAVMRAALGVLALAGVPSLAACSSAPRRVGPASGLHPLALVGARENIAPSAVPNLRQVVAGMRTFGDRLHAETATVAENWTASPLSVDVAFGMLRAGCRGSSATEVDNAFGFPHATAPAGSPHAALNALTRSLVTTAAVDPRRATLPSSQPAPDPIVAVANGLFLDDAFAPHVQKAFRSLLSTQYGASPTGVSFKDPSAAAVINAWVTAQTRHRITKLFDDIDPSTLLVLANAVYFKAAWQNQFNPLQTADGRFTTAAGRSVTASMMTQTLESAGYTAGDGWQRVSLPYVGNQLLMRVVVPTVHATNVGQLATALAAATGPAREEQTAVVDLTLPRWNTATSISLIPALRALGITDLFNDRADLTGIAPALVVNDVIHRATITVDEQGSEAAAITGISVGDSAIIGAPRVLRADRPFAWAIVHGPTGAPIFAGHVTDPTAA